MKNSLRISLIQADIIWKKIPENLAKYEHFIASVQNSDLIVLPEMFATGFIHDPESVHPSQELITDWLTKISEKTNSTLIASHPFFADSNNYNRLFVSHPKSELLHYDKRHLFAYGGEKDSYTPGKERLVSAVEGWKFLPLICYDLRFPVWSRNDSNYELLLYIANWPAERMRIWEVLLRARAIENQCYVAGVNRTGTDGNSIRYTGHSMIISPAGEILKSMDDKEGILEAELSLTDLLDFKKKYPFLQDRDAFKLIKNPARSS